MTKAENPGIVRRAYDWILSWAHHPAGTWALGVFAFIDSSIFPIPPLFLQIALSMERPKRSWWYAAVNTACSVLGAVLGFVIGWALYASIGQWIIRVNGLEEQFAHIGGQFGQNAFAFILLWSFLPFPFKIITIGAGVYSSQVGLGTLLLASTLGRSARFFLLAAMCCFWGARAKAAIERHFRLVTLGIALLVVAVLGVMKFVLR